MNGANSVRLAMRRGQYSFVLLGSGSNFGHCGRNFWDNLQWTGWSGVVFVLPHVELW